MNYRNDKFQFGSLLYAIARLDSRPRKGAFPFHGQNASEERRLPWEKGARRALTYDDRLAIERGLNRGDRVSWIARSIGRARKVVAEEVKRNWTDDPRGMLVLMPI